MTPMAIDVYGAKYSESAWGPRGGKALFIYYALPILIF